MIVWGIFEGMLSTIVSSLFLVAVVATIIVVVLDNRNPVKTLAWVLVLSFLPVVGLVFYFFFGRDVRKEKMISKRGYSRLSKYQLSEYYEREPVEERHHLMRFFRKVNGSLPFDGNNIEIYTTAYQMLPALLKAIAHAQHHIHLQFYIFEDDAVGRMVRDALIEKAKQSVEVRLLYDDVGSWKVDHSFFEQMREAGIETRGFLKVRFPMFTSKVNYRNHRKVAVIDGRIGFVGGMNIAMRYLKGVSWGVWRDTHVRMEGCAVYGLQVSFLTDWYAADHSLITSSHYYPEMPVCGESSVQVVTSNPIGGGASIMQGLLVAIASSRKYFYIQTPYLLPTEPILMALKASAMGGVDVRIMIPERGDSRITHLASLSYLDELLECGVRIYRYKKGFLHSKLIVSDDVISTIGSTNIDFRSFEHNFEVNAFMYDSGTALRMKEIFLADQKDAELLQIKEWRMRPWYQKVGESVIRLFAPLL